MGNYLSVKQASAKAKHGAVQESKLTLHAVVIFRVKPNKTKKHQVSTPSLPSQERTTPLEPIFHTNGKCILCALSGYYLAMRVNWPAVAEVTLVNDRPAPLLVSCQFPINLLSGACCEQLHQSQQRSSATTPPLSHTSPAKPKIWKPNCVKKAAPACSIHLDEDIH